MSFELTIAACLLGVIFTIITLAMISRQSLNLEQWIAILLTWQFVVLLTNYGLAVAETNTTPTHDYTVLMETASLIVGWMNYILIFYFVILLLLSILFWIAGIVQKKPATFKLKRGLQ